MELPIGFYPFTLDFLQGMTIVERNEYLATLESLWMSFLASHRNQLLPGEVISPESEQKLHYCFLTQINSFYNSRFHTTHDPIFPTFEKKGGPTSPLYALLLAARQGETNLNSKESLSVVGGQKYLTRTATRDFPHALFSGEEEFSSPARKKRKLPHTEEKRLSRYRSSPSKALLERLNETYAGTFLLIEEEFDPEAKTIKDCVIERNYRVWDRTKNIYNVHISNLPACNCPASSKGLNCVHILFIFSKLLLVQQQEPTLFQRALLTTELINIYSDRLPHPSSTCLFCYDHLPKTLESNYHCACGRKFHPFCIETTKNLPRDALSSQVLCRLCNVPRLNKQ